MMFVLEVFISGLLSGVMYSLVALGFGVLAFSDFAFIRHLGILTAGLMVLCLLADLLLLPVLLLRLKASPEGARPSV